jgi:Mrp family chromosome partitioning ATPase/predicted Fe-Mo cluster-binding NifX family protein
MDLVPEKVLRPEIKRVIGIVSGKGGVGKSTVAVLLAEALASRGRSVGLLDADITGPSIPRLLGVESFRAESDGTRLYPIENEEGIKVVSINLFSEDEDAPVIWRGPLLAKAIEQFWSDADWGGLDYLIVDFPPGTSDIALTAFQTIPFAGVVVVATPQDYVSMIVTKSVRMASMLKTPVIGLVENMRTMVCPECGEEVQLFDGGASGHSRLGLPLLASLPWRKEVAQAPSLRWSALPEAARRDADRIAGEVEIAVRKQEVTMLKIAVPSRDDGLVDEHFGHCKEFRVFRFDDKKALVEESVIPSADGCGCKSDIASTLAKAGVSCLVAGNMGEGAVRVLGAQGISVVRGASGDARAAALAFARGDLADSGVGCSAHGQTT